MLSYSHCCIFKKTTHILKLFPHNQARFVCESLSARILICSLETGRLEDWKTGVPVLKDQKSNVHDLSTYVYLPSCVILPVTNGHTCI